MSTQIAPGRVVIDTSAPFDSVKEAVNRFGGMATWKSTNNAPQRNRDIAGIIQVEEEAAQLQRDLVKKERETLDVLKELETTKNIVQELKVKLQNEASEINSALKANDAVISVTQEEDNCGSDKNACPDGIGGIDLCPSEAPGFILLELKQAKLNLKRTTDDLADIRATVDLYSKKIEKERLSLEKTRQRLSANSSKISSLEEEISETKKMERSMKDAGNSDDPLIISRELQKLSAETEEFKKVGEAARTEVMRAMSEIEQTKVRIRTAEIRLVAAKKMKEAAKVSEALALAEIKALSKSERRDKSEDVTLTFKEYSSLVAKAQESEKACNERVVDTMVKVDEANASKSEILKKVEEATEEVKVSKRALEEALNRVEAANRGKLAVEEALRIWRSEHGHKRRNVHNPTKFKNPHPSAHRKDSRLLDVNGLNLVDDPEVKPVLKPTLSIGQILSQKLMLNEEYENGVRAERLTGKRKVSLGQMLSKTKAADSCEAKKSGKENKEVLSSKRKKFSLGRISVLVAKQNRKKKKGSNAA